MKAVVLAGGKGTRLRPLTFSIPKPLLPIAEKPILEIILKNLKKFGITDILISIGFKGEKIKEYFGDGKRFGVNITYIEEDEPLGTAGPLKLAKKFLKSSFIALNLIAGFIVALKDSSSPLLRIQAAHSALTFKALKTRLICQLDCSLCKFM